MFEDMTQQIRRSISQIISYLEIKTEVEMPRGDAIVKNNGKTNITKSQRVSRNSKCPCGSGSKYKNCCGKLS